MLESYESTSTFKIYIQQSTINLTIEQGDSYNETNVVVIYAPTDVYESTYKCTRKEVSIPGFSGLIIGLLSIFTIPRIVRKMRR